MKVDYFFTAEININNFNLFFFHSNFCALSDTTVVDVLRPMHVNIGVAAAFYAQSLGLAYIAIVLRGASSSK